MFICSFLLFCILIISINLSNKLVKINMRSKEINLHNERFKNITRSIVMNCSSGISMVVYVSTYVYLMFT
jgi:hypothetical protein